MKNTKGAKERCSTRSISKTLRPSLDVSGYFFELALSPANLGWMNHEEHKGREGEVLDSVDI